MLPFPVVPCMIVVLGGAAAVVSSKRRSRGMTTERQAIFDSAMAIEKDPDVLRKLAKHYREEGLTIHANALLQRAAMRALPPHVRALRREAFQKGMKSTDVQAIETLAKAFKHQGYSNNCDQLMRHAAEVAGITTKEVVTAPTASAAPATNIDPHLAVAAANVSPDAAAASASKSEAEDEDDFGPDPDAEPEEDKNPDNTGILTSVATATATPTDPATISLSGGRPGNASPNPSAEFSGTGESWYGFKGIEDDMGADDALRRAKKDLQARLHPKLMPAARALNAVPRQYRRHVMHKLGRAPAPTLALPVGPIADAVDNAAQLLGVLPKRARRHVIANFDVSSDGDDQ